MHRPCSLVARQRLYGAHPASDAGEAIRDRREFKIEPAAAGCSMARS
jgi:hypothetical protein